MPGYLHACKKPVRCQKCWDRAFLHAEGLADTIADLQRQLQQAQEEREQDLRDWEKAENTSYFQIGAMVERHMAELRVERDAAIERADGNYRLYQELRRETNKAIQAAEQAIERAGAAQRDAAGQRALAETLAQAVVGIGYDREHQEGWRCKLCHAWWPLNTKPGHEDDCPLAPAEAPRAESPQSGQEEGD